MANSFLQVRVDESDKEKASRILDHLGTNLSTVVNMLIKQIIITESIPFEIKMGPKDSGPYPVPETAAAAFNNSNSDFIENPVIKGIREEYEGF
ncbi:MAG: type II toxin-antitoxin system RelB/DinJ family antitoxin [Eubacterium sp.]|nr:type II toxin-antitoxin system RelB/DinJ family antitoxin [Eubacterium sp.]